MDSETKIVKDRHLFIFKPHGWLYYGGAIGVIADTFDSAVELIINTGLTSVPSSKRHKYRATSRTQFFRSLNSVNGDVDNKWVLTYELTINGTGPEMILFDNWNYKRPKHNTGGNVS